MPWGTKHRRVSSKACDDALYAWSVTGEVHDDRGTGGESLRPSQPSLALRASYGWQAVTASVLSAASSQRALPQAKAVAP